MQNCLIEASQTHGTARPSFVSLTLENNKTVSETQVAEVAAAMHQGTMLAVSSLSNINPPVTAGTETVRVLQLASIVPDGSKLADELSDRHNLLRDAALSQSTGQGPR